MYLENTRGKGTVGMGVQKRKTLLNEQLSSEELAIVIWEFNEARTTCLPHGSPKTVILSVFYDCLPSEKPKFLKVPAPDHWPGKQA